MVEALEDVVDFQKRRIREVKKDRTTLNVSTKKQAEAVALKRRRRRSTSSEKNSSVRRVFESPRDCAADLYNPQETAKVDFKNKAKCPSNDRVRIQARSSCH